MMDLMHSKISTNHAYFAMVNEGGYSVRLYCKLKIYSFYRAGCDEIASYVPIFKFSLPCHLRS